jgi:hypothetical protein
VIPSELDTEELFAGLAMQVARTWVKYLKPFESCQVRETTHKYIHLTEKKTERINLGVLNKCESKNDEMLDICEAVHTAVPGHQDSEDIANQPTRTAFEGHYLTFE